MNYKNHNHIVQNDNIKLRPICETDWKYLFEWNKDKEINNYVDYNRIKINSIKSREEIRLVFKNLK